LSGLRRRVLLLSLSAELLLDLSLNLFGQAQLNFLSPLAHLRSLLPKFEQLVVLSTVLRLEERRDALGPLVTLLRLSD